MVGAFWAGLILAPEKGAETRANSDVFATAPITARPDSVSVFPCTSATRFENPYAPCLLIIAGGKRLVFGAPDGQSWQSIGFVDAAFLYNGHPVSSGGLMGLRHQTWRDGRDQPLLVVAGDLQVDALTLLDDAQASADALLKVEHSNRLDFRNAGVTIKPVPIQSGTFRVFDTGDLKVFASSSVSNTGDQIIVYDILYSGKRIRFLPCDGALPAEPADIVIRPTAETASLTELIRGANRDRRYADLVDLQRLARTCPTLRDAIDEAAEIGASKLIVVHALRDADIRIGAQEVDVIQLGRDGVRDL